MKNKQFSQRSLYFLATTLVVAALFFTLENESPELKDPSPDSLSRVFSWKNLTKKILPTPSGKTEEVVPNSEPINEAQPAEIQKLSQWLQEEAKTLDSFSQAPGTEQRLKDRARNLKENEIQFLAQVANDLVHPANHRILATYLITLSLEKTLLGLEAVLTAPLQIPAADAAKTHSPEETLSMQEKALKRMAIDAMIEKLKKDPSWRAQAEAIFRSIPDSSLRQYAESRLLDL